MDRKKNIENKKNHIGFFISALHGGGAERVFVILANEFAERGYIVDLVLIRKKGPYLKDVMEKVNIIDLNVSGVLKSLFPLIQYLRIKNPDILISTLNRVNLVAIAAKIISHCFVKLIIRQANCFTSLSNRKTKLLGRFLYHREDAIVAISDGVKKNLMETFKLSEQKIKVIYNPVFRTSILKDSKKEVDHPFFKEKGYKVILGVGRLEKQKNFSLLIKAFNKVREARKVRLIICGEGKQREELEDLIQEQGLENDISMPGFVDNPYAYMAKADVFVLSSLYEGFGNVLVEAMACGTPVVSTDCPSGPSEIIEKGKYGKLVPINDINSLAEAILETLDHPLDKMLLQKRAKYFSVEKSVKKYQDLLNECIEK
ncbi:MAG: glycosyltransferase [Candidatus Atribacteria bacterium]|nr:glycosyltransferase [Candidatus Atribacteria bacterium]